MLNAWFSLNATTRTRTNAEKEPPCFVVYNPHGAAGTRLVSRPDANGGLPTLMGAGPRKAIDANATQGAQTQPAEELKEVCLVHFQGDSKHLIMPFEAFLEGEFVLP